MKTIVLSKGQVTLVDDGDYDWLTQWTWYCNYQGYATRTYRNNKGKQVRVAMHRVIMDTPVGLETDHIDFDRLNNQKHNLRIATHSENQRNKRRRVDNKSGYIGVSLDKKYGTWRAQAMKDGKQISVGSYKTAKEAAVARDNYVKSSYGSFVRLNFPN